MSVEMKQKAGTNVTPKDDALLYDFLIADSGVVEGCVASAIGGTQMKITSGRGVILGRVPFPVSWTVKMKKKQKETQDILSYHTQAAGCSDKARAKASGGRQPIEECGRTGL